jgi:hypothetical protein
MTLQLSNDSENCTKTENLDGWSLTLPDQKIPLFAEIHAFPVCEFPRNLNQDNNW